MPSFASDGPHPHQVQQNLACPAASPLLVPQFRLVPPQAGQVPQRLALFPLHLLFLWFFRLVISTFLILLLVAFGCALGSRCCDLFRALALAPTCLFLVSCFSFCSSFPVIALSSKFSPSSSFPPSFSSQGFVCLLKLRLEALVDGFLLLGISKDASILSIHGPPY